MSREPLSAVAVAVLTAGALACLASSVFAQQPPGKPPSGPVSPAPGPTSPVPSPPTSASPKPAPTTASPPTASPSTQPAQAAPTPAAPSLEAKERARVAYARGQAAFAGGDYAQAKVAFEEAFAAVPNPIVLLSVAESAVKIGRIEDAIAALDQYLQLRPDAPDHADIAQKRAALTVMPAHVWVTSEPAGAGILVDGQTTGKKTPAELDVSPGDHQLQAALAGYESDAAPIHATPGARIEQRLDLHAASPPPTAAAVAPSVALRTPTALPTQVPTTALWITGTIGVAGLVAGTVLGFLALKEHSDFQSKPTEASADRGERLALFSDVGFGIGAMAAVTAAVLYFTNDDVAPAPATTAQAQRPSPTLAASRLQLIPRLSASSASATARIRF